MENVAEPRRSELLEVLTEARLRNGQPSLREMATRAGISHTGIHEFFNGTRLPSLPYVLRVANAVGFTDSQEIQQLWSKARETAPQYPRKKATMIDVLQEISVKLDLILEAMGSQRDTPYADKVVPD
jgi:transcriptional regulator with XRE-family HTH domain